MDFQHHCDEQGFAIIPAVLADPDISKLEQAFACADVRRSKAGVRHALKHSPVAEMAHDERLLEIVRRVLGTGAFPFRATLFDKSPNSNWLVVWHQDTALPLRERHETPGWGPWSVKDGVIYAHAPENALSQVLALRLHLDDSTEENGPLRVLPKTHTLGVLSDEELHNLSTRVAPVDCLVPCSGVLAMRPLIVHASLNSQSSAPRRDLHIEYSASYGIDNGLDLD